MESADTKKTLPRVRQPGNYREHLESLSIDTASLVADPAGTIAYRRSSRGTPALPPLRIDGDNPELQLEGRVGGGGMGDVHLASQLPLRRRVAVKTARPDTRARAALLDEALVTGALEHPNVIPVHNLGAGEDGEPMLVMRYIEGTRWSDRAIALFVDDEGDHEAVEEHLQIFVQVCNAVAFAHSMGVLHRDIKPANVMLGRFGEVYLVDWGLAVALHDNAPGNLELACNVDGVVGTPAYMAPEMAAATGELIDQRSDIYLLGAVLYELITGLAPHERDDVVSSLEASFAAHAAELPPETPRELVSIVRRAMCFDPKGRFASAEEMRDAVVGFLRHRSANVSARRAMRRVKQLRKLFNRTHFDEQAESQIHQLATEARFGFQQALKDWPDSPDASAGLCELLEAMITWHISRGELPAARAALLELPSPRPDLGRRVEAASAGEERAKEERARELDELRQIAVDSRLGGPHVNWMMASAGAALVIPAVVLTVLRLGFDRRAGYPEVVGVAVFLSLITAAGRVRFGSELNASARKLQLLFLAGTPLCALALCAGWFMGADLTVGLVIILFVMATIELCLGALVHRKLAWAALPTVLSIVGVLLVPALRGLFVAAGFGLGFLLIYRLWRGAEMQG